MNELDQLIADIVNWFRSLFSGGSAGITSGTSYSQGQFGTSTHQPGTGTHPATGSLTQVELGSALPGSSNSGPGGITSGYITSPVQRITGGLDANGTWSSISTILANANPNAQVRDVVDIQGSAAVNNSAAPEQVATVSQYQALVLGQYPGGTGQYAPGAPVDVSRGLTQQDVSNNVNYLQGVQATGGYNPNLPAISSQGAVGQLITSEQQGAGLPVTNPGAPYFVTDPRTGVQTMHYGPSPS